MQVYLRIFACMNRLLAYTLLVLALILVSIACKRQKSISESPTQSMVATVDSTEIENAPPLEGLQKVKIIPLRRKAQRIADQWTNFPAFDAKVKELKSVSRPRLYSFVEETEVLYDELLQVKIPLKFDTPQIKSRLLLFKTLLLKLKDKADDTRFSDEELVQSIKEVTNAYNAIRKQMNNIALDDIDSDEYINPDTQ